MTEEPTGHPVLAANMRRAYEASGLTQGAIGERMAAVMGLEEPFSNNTVWRWLDANRLPNLFQIEAFAAVVDVTTESLIRETKTGRESDDTPLLKAILAELRAINAKL